MLFRSAQIKLENAALELFTETPGRVLVAISPDNSTSFESLAKSQNIKIAKIGKTGGESLVINDLNISLKEISDAFTQTFPKLFG